MHARSPQMHFARPSFQQSQIGNVITRPKKIGASSWATWQPASLPFSPFPSLPKPLSLVGSPRGCLSWRYYRYGTTMQRCPLQAFPGVFGRSARVLHPPPYLFAQIPWLSSVLDILLSTILGFTLCTCNLQLSLRSRDILYRVR